ncbi:DUF1073 domain-containing protein [Paenibacillus sp. P26]|nr:DUF1073 domain-containing protein [Paenibacillus sp. P26]
MFSNALARLGYGTPNLGEGAEYPLTRLTNNYQLINSLYRTHWVIQRVVDTIPEDATRNWIDIQSAMDPATVTKLDRVWRKRRLKEKLLHGLKWGRLYGGAGGLIVIEGHEDILDQPLDLDMVMPGSLKNLIILDRWSGIYPSEEIVTDVNDVEFGLPLYYQATLEDGHTERIHHSRILRFSGRELPYWERMAMVNWGESEIEVVFEELKKRDNTSWNIAQLVFLANLRVLKMGDLRETLAITNPQVQQDLYNTLQQQNWLMSNQGIYVLNAEDSMETHQYSFSGLSDVYEQFMMDLSGASKIPVTKLFGRSPAGMNATGESDMQNYYETLQQYQETTIAPILDKLLPIVCVSELGAVPDDLDYIFNPIRNPSDDELAKLVQQKSDAVINVFQAGIIGRRTALKELKEMSATTGMFTNITDEAIEAADDDVDPGELTPNEAFSAMGSEEEDTGGLPQRPTQADARSRKILDFFRRSG